MNDMDNVKSKVLQAVRTFAERDWEYLRGKGVYEVAISHRIAVYLENLFEGYDVDCEYNKDKGNPKKNSKNDKIRPDIIIHKRNSDENLCIIEIKKSGKDSHLGEHDIKKIEDTVKTGLNYNLGVFIGVLKTRIDVCWIEKINGTVEKTCEVLP